MIRRTILMAVCVVMFWSATSVVDAQESVQAYGRQWGHSYNPQDWNRAYYFPGTFYPHSYYPREYFRSGTDVRNRYPVEMQIPAFYNPAWINYYPSPRRYHQGGHFTLDVF